MSRNDAKFRAIFDHAINGMALIDKNLRFLDVNPVLCELLQYSSDRMVGRSIVEFAPAEHRKKIAEITVQLEARNAWRGIFPLIGDHQKLVQLEWSISFHSIPNIRLAMVSDITKRLQIESELKTLLDRERTARADAERANRLKDDFLATVSHELRTPLNAIIGWSQLLQRGHADETEIAQGLDAITRNAQVQSRLIADLLDVARITAGKLRLDVQPVDLGATLDAALTSVGLAADAKAIRVHKSVDADAGAVSGDPSRLQQVFWNLLSNAVKFTPKAGHIHVRLARIESYSEVSIADNGQGIEPDLLPHIFERFRQGDSSTTRGHGGLGLGLAIAKHLVEMHGGNIRAHSDGPGLGATFTVSLPISPLRTSRPSAFTAPSGQPPRAAKSLRLDGIRILIVDDDEDARRLIAQLLADSAAETRDVPSAAHALAVVDQFKPHLLISDIGMPDHDGYELIRQIRARGYSQQKLPAIALTAFARAEDRRHALQAGFQAHVCKPVDAAELTTAIATLTGRAEKDESHASQ